MLTNIILSYEDFNRIKTEKESFDKFFKEKCLDDKYTDIDKVTKSLDTSYCLFGLIGNINEPFFSENCWKSILNLKTLPCFSSSINDFNLKIMPKRLTNQNNLVYSYQADIPLTETLRTNSKIDTLSPKTKNLIASMMPVSLKFTPSTLNLTNQLNSENTGIKLPFRFNQSKISPISIQSLTSKPRMKNSRQTIYTKLNQINIISSIYNIYAVVSRACDHIRTCTNEYSMTLLLKDETLTFDMDVIVCVLFAKTSEALPKAPLNSIIKLHGIMTQKYQSKIQARSTPGYTWTVYSKGDDGYYLCDSNDPDSNYSDDLSSILELDRWLNGFETELTENMKTFDQIDSFMPSIIVSGMVIGIFYFEEQKKFILIITDGTKCGSDSSVDVCYADSTWCNVSLVMMDRHRNTLNYISVPSDYMLSRANIIPLYFVQVRISSFLNNKSIQFELVDSETKSSLVNLSLTSSVVLDIKTRLASSEINHTGYAWCSVVLPGLNIVNTHALGAQPSFHKIEPEHAFQIKLSDEFSDITRTNVRDLIRDTPNTESKIFHISARIVMIWPETFSDGVTGYCDVCGVNFEKDCFEHIQAGTVTCKDCQKPYALKLRFILLLAQEDNYLICLLSQERALHFFGLDCKINELTPCICTEMDEKYRNFFLRYTEIKIQHNSDPPTDIFIMSRCVKNLGLDENKQGVIYEICGVSLVFIPSIIYARFICIRDIDSCKSRVRCGDSRYCLLI
ncbi:hypothetical protein HZS_838 [Henneguya salminicola]|nr:hypothetical protein HZS_838 [Henneguya salminicola]